MGFNDFSATMALLFLTITCDDYRFSDDVLAGKKALVESEQFSAFDCFV